MMLGDTYAMNERWIARTASVAALALCAIISPNIAQAEPTPRAIPAPDSTRSPAEQYKFDRDQYLLAVKIRSQQIKEINNTFKSACDKATQDYKFAMSSARTPDQKNLASSNRKYAISAAIVARDAAIVALGPEPIAPMEPIKSMKASSKNKSR